MKRNKGFTLVEFLILAAIVGIIVAIAVPNLKAALAKEKATDRAKKYHTEYVPPVQEIKQVAGSNRVSITQVGEAGGITYYIVRDLNTSQEYLVGKLFQFGEVGLAMTKMEK